MKELSIDSIESVTGGEGPNRPDRPTPQQERGIRNAVWGYLADQAIDRVMETFNDVASEHAARVYGAMRANQGGYAACSEAASAAASGTVGGYGPGTPGFNGGFSGCAGGDGGGGGGRVICTHLMRQGLLDPAIWRADLAFTYKHLSPTTVRGYHLWAIPYVRLMRKSPLAQKLMRPLATWRAEELAYQMSVLQKSNWKGKVVRWTCEPICFALGIFAKEQNWQGLWDSPAPRVETTSAA